MALVAAACLATGMARAAEPAVLQGKAAYGNWQSDAPGTVRLIRPEDLPQPGATPSSANVSRVVPRPDTKKTKVPDGFKIALFAEGLSGPRKQHTTPNNNNNIAETRAIRIRVLRPVGD